MFHKILVAIDRSELSSQILEQSICLAQSNHATLMLLSVLAPFEQIYSEMGYPAMNGAFFGANEETMRLYLDQWQALEQDNIDWLRSRTAEATIAGVSTEFTHNVGDPGRVICALAQTWEADLIIVGRRGLSGLSELFLGSVSNYVVHHAACSVLTVKRSLPSTQEATQKTQTMTTP